MPTTSALDVEAAPPASDLWVPITHRGAKLKPSTGLTHSYTTDTKLLTEADWVYLQIAYAAYQIHPATVADLAALGPVGGRDALRWTIEGPLVHRPGDPGEQTDCVVTLEIAYSLSADPGANWIRYKPDTYRLRSAKARLTITRPSTAYSFRVIRFALLAHRVAAPQRPRKVHAGVSDVIPSGMCRVVVRDFEVLAGATLEVEAGAYLEVLT